MRIAISDRAYFADGRQFGTARGIGAGRGGGGGQARGAPNPNAVMNARFVGTLGEEDTRRPRMELGLGVWVGKTYRYYPVTRIQERGGALLDRLDERTLLIYIDPETNTPAALYVETAKAAIESKDVILDNGSVVRSGVLLDRRGQRLKMERPQQLFTRWYGWALTFPGAEVFGQ
jgi:hypothetical protein